MAGLSWYLRAWRRRHLARTLPDGPMRDFYSRPLPAQRSGFAEVPFAVLDFETTGLDIKVDHVISLGYVSITNLGINLDSAWHEVIATPRELPEQSTVIHGLTDDRVAQGMPLERVMPDLLEHLAGKILVAHHAAIELGFLRRICHTLYGAPLHIPFLDTRELARRHLRRQPVAPEEGGYRLFNLRRRFGLPAYTAHNALYDALSTAELFLALLCELYPNLDGRLRDLRPRMSRG